MAKNKSVNLFYVECEQCEVYLWTEDGWMKTHQQPVAGDRVVCLSGKEYKEHTVQSDLSRVFTPKLNRTWNGLTPEMLTVSIVSASDLLHAQKVA